MCRTGRVGSLLCRAAIAMLTLLAVPGGASALDIQTRQVQPDVLFVEDHQKLANQLVVNWVTSPSGAPDIVIADTKAGIRDPIPAPCARVDSTTARCPALDFDSLYAALGRGNDVAIIAVPTITTAGFITMTLYAGPGNDRARDSSDARDLWYGGSGRDILFSGPANDRILGGAQNDLIDCGAGPHDVGIGGPGPLDLGRHCEVVKH